MAGYSANPLYKKLGFTESQVVKLVHAPAHYPSLPGDAYTGLQINNTATAGIDFVHFFANSRAALEATLPQLMQQLKKDGMIWVSWYKKAAEKPIELTEDIVRNTALACGLVDVKVCAVDEDWSGLKLVYRLADR
jgi:hypothetical protein